LITRNLGTELLPMSSWILRPPISNLAAASIFARVQQRGDYGSGALDTPPTLAAKLEDWAPVDALEIAGTVAHYGLIWVPSAFLIGNRKPVPAGNG
jgi:hypothetical protein